MKNIVDTINNDNKNTFEGFFDNVNANPFKALDDFLKDNKQRIVTLKGKDYLIHNLLYYQFLYYNSSFSYDIHIHLYLEL